MKKRMFTGAVAAIALLAGLTACSTEMDTPKSDSMSMSSEDQMADESMSDTQMTDSPMSGEGATSGEFEGLNGKMVAGKAELTDTELVLSGFSSDEGPDLHVYLTNGTDEAAVAAGMMIDAVAFDEAEQTFMLTDVDTSKYTDVVIHCDKAKAVFGAAPLA